MPGPTGECSFQAITWEDYSHLQNPLSRERIPLRGQQNSFHASKSLWMGLARKTLNCLEGRDQDLFKNHKWARLSCVHYIEWHLLYSNAQGLGPLTVVRPNSPTAGQRKHPPHPAPGQAMLISARPCLVPPRPSVPSLQPRLSTAAKQIFPHDYQVCPFCFLRTGGVPLSMPVTSGGPPPLLISSSLLPWSLTTLQGQ